MSLEAMTEEAERLAGYRARLTEQLEDLRQRRADLDKSALPEIRRIVELAADSKAKLLSAIHDEPHLFGRKRSKTVMGVKFGIQKQKGKVEIPDQDKTIKLIRKLLPDDQAALLITVREQVHKPSVADLTAADLKRLAISITEDSDAPFVKTVDNEIDKLVDALLGNDDIEDSGA